MKKSVLMGMAMAAGILGCATEPTKDPTKLEFINTGKPALTVGETSPKWVMSKTSVGVTGKTSTENPYAYFTLISSDTNVASVVDAQQLLAKKSGTTQVTARDDRNSNLETETSALITVVDAP
ncbi:MAG: hypothetical protein ABI036_00535 [Fibrobacteria bacterium]